MPARADLGFLFVAALVAALICMYVRRRWRMSVEKAAEVRRLTWLAVEEAARAELESEALVCVAPVLITSSSSSREDDVGANGASVVGSQCAVCYRRTSTRCSRCKTVRYCSGKCQIMHWRQGHKDNCHPPKIDHGIKISKPDPSDYYVGIETSAYSKHLDATSTKSSHKSHSSSSVFETDHHSAKPVVDGRGTESISALYADSSSPMLKSTSSSGCSTHLPTPDDASSSGRPFLLDGEKIEAPCSNNLDASPSKRKPSTMGRNNPISVTSRSSDTSLLNEKTRRPQSSLFHVKDEPLNDILSRKDNVQAVYSKNDYVPELIAKSAVNTLPNGCSNLKTSIKRAVQQLRPSHFSKHSSEIRTAASLKHQMLFPYELFVKLYNCDKLDMRPCGLTNCGNSCYANAVLQCLAFTRPLTSYLLQGYHAKTCPKRGWCFTCEFASLLVKAKQGQSPLSPIGILSQIHNIGSNLGQGRQEDAHEFLRYAIEAMQVVCLKEARINVPGKFIEATTFIQMIFGGYLRSKIKCMRCRRISECNERIMDLTIEIHGDIETLEEALAQFTGTEILDGVNRYECSSCQSYERATKKLSILEAPNVLTIALKRFQSGKFDKLNKAVRFSKTLVLDPFMTCADDGSHVYSLYAVVVHQGTMNTAFCGHYICYVKSFQNKWYKADDSKVKSVDIERVLASKAYMLFYARHSPQQPIDLQTTDDIYDKKLPYPRTDSSSDISSIFSLSDEGSCSTDSTSDSTSTEELSEYIFGRYNSSPVLSEDSYFGSISSPFLELEHRVLCSDSRKLTDGRYYRGSRETDMLFRRSNATRERRDEVL